MPAPERDVNLISPLPLPVDIEFPLVTLAILRELLNHRPANAVWNNSTTKSRTRRAVSSGRTPQ